MLRLRGNKPLAQAMEIVTFFKVGDTYTNDQIRFSLDLENLGASGPH